MLFNINEITAGAVIPVVGNVTLGDALVYVAKGGLITLEADLDNPDHYDVLTKEGAQYTIEPVKGE